MASLLLLIFIVYFIKEERKRREIKKNRERMTNNLSMLSLHIEGLGRELTDRGIYEYDVVQRINSMSMIVRDMVKEEV